MSGAIIVATFIGFHIGLFCISYGLRQIDDFAIVTGIIIIAVCIGIVFGSGVVENNNQISDETDYFIDCDGDNDFEVAHTTESLTDEKADSICFEKLQSGAIDNVGSVNYRVSAGGSP